MRDIITFSGVGKSFATKRGELVATRDVTVSIQEGEIVSIVGPSGCGKTTMLNIVAGLMKPTQGTVLYRGEPGDRAQRPHRLHDTERSPAAVARCGHNIAVPLEIRGVAAADRAAPRRRADRARRSHALREHVSIGALGRHAEAHGAGPAARVRPGNAAARRAVCGARRPAAFEDADRAHRPQPAAQ